MKATVWGPVDQSALEDREDVLVYSTQPLAEPLTFARNLEAKLFDSINLAPILTGEQPEQPRTLYWHINRTGRNQKAVRHDQWKYIQDSNVEMLFDLSTDISERRDVSFQNPETFTDLKHHLAAWEAELAKERIEFLVK